MSKFSLIPPPGTTLDEARAMVREVTYALERESSPYGHVRILEVLPADVPEWEQDCACTFSVYVIHLAGQEHELAFQRLYEHDGYQVKTYSREEHERLERGDP